MSKIYAIKKYWVDGRTTQDIIWTSKKRIAEKWVKQAEVNVLIDKIEIVEKEQK